MMSPSIEPVPGFPEEVNPRARASLSSGVANFVWMATTGGRVIHYVPKVKYGWSRSGRFLQKRYRGGHHRLLPPVYSNHAISRGYCGYQQKINRSQGVKGVNTNTGFDNVAGHKLIHAATCNFWRTAMSPGLRLQIGRYSNSNDIAS